MDEQKPVYSQQGNIHGPIVLLLIWIFTNLLKLYPRRFYETFGDEMLDVFSSYLNDVAQEGPQALIGYFLRESAEFPVALMGQHMYERKRQMTSLLRYDTKQELNLARWVARALSILIGGFVLMIFLLNDDVRNDPTLPTIVVGMLTIGLLIAWRWERLGGLIVVFLSPILVLSMVIQWSGAEGLLTPPWQLILIGITISLSFVITGWLFISVAQHTEVTGPTSGGDESIAPSGGRRWIILVLVLLGMAAGLFFLIPMVIPVQQQMEFPDDRASTSGIELVINRLRGQQAVVGIGSNTFERAPFSVTGRDLNVNGAIIQVFNYPDYASVTNEVSAMKTAGKSGWKDVSWNGQPHMYQMNKEIVLYVGSDSELLALLEASFGSPIIGE